ncbi:hypothetical protein PMAYCL1PPCAC_27906, partial [Pristionchus mayeri]
MVMVESEASLEARSKCTRRFEYRTWKPFRFKTSELVKRSVGGAGNDMDLQMADRIARMRIGTTSLPVIYRYADIIKNSTALLEAIHFELFLPDRPDLRFIAIPLIPNTAEGDYFQVVGADLLPYPSFFRQN